MNLLDVIGFGFVVAGALTVLLVDAWRRGKK
jgi:hypothetical protein